MLYECHITCYVKDEKACNKVAKDLHWKTSEIKRDPVLGDNSYYYLTTHSNDIEEMFKRLRHCCQVLEYLNVEVVRQKIELIIYDTKVKV